MYRVLMGIDKDNERAMAQAKAVADLPAASEEVEAMLFHCFTKNPEGASVNQVDAVRDAKDYLEDKNVKITMRESSGDPASEILKFADKEDANSVCVAGRRRTPAGKVVFGSVTQSVILSSKKPVIVAGVED